jgi:hypothetical protein
MLLKLYHIELPEFIVGTLGIGFIGLALHWSNRHAKELAAVMQK